MIESQPVSRTLPASKLISARRRVSLTTLAIAISILADAAALTTFSMVAYAIGAESSHWLGVVNAIGVNIVIVTLLTWFHRWVLIDVGAGSGRMRQGKTKYSGRL